MDPGKVIRGVFGKHPLSCIQFGAGDEVIAASVMSANSVSSYFLFSESSKLAVGGIEVISDSPLEYDFSSGIDLVIVDASYELFSIVIYMAVEDLLREGGCLCICGNIQSRLGLLNTMSKEGLIAPYGKSDYDSDNIILMTMSDGKLARVF